MSEPKPNTPSPPRRPREVFSELWEALKDWFRGLLDLREGLDREGTIVAIRTNKRMQGANAWLLGCSIMIASLGLDLNSPAVIIGAMLVSPLMSPILGIGLGVAINDKNAMFTAMWHFAVAIVIALVTSTFYFFITPFGNLTEEIQSRTSPTFLDGLVAIFGGFAGIISTTRKDKTNAIPGVAIATALMPPLCVTGFGIAEFFELLIDQELQGAERGLALSRAAGIAGGSFYLFFLNSFFIALTTYIIIRLLRFPFKSYVNRREALRNRIITALFSLLVTLPSAFILYKLYLLEQDKQEVGEFVQDFFPQACINYELTGVGPDTNKLILQLLGKRIPEDSIGYYEQLLAGQYELNKPVRLFPMQAEMSMSDVKSSLQEQRQEVFGLLETERRKAEEDRRQREVLEERLIQEQIDSSRVERTLRIAREAFPGDIHHIQYAPFARSYQDTSMTEQQHLFLVKWSNRKGTAANKDRLRGILRVGTDFDTLTVVSY
ncbi:MAG: DUF389 domain-containing protein [Bacteroidetes bacterium]|jgi:uncharacterized hydrophobic protein (TIGR00271 family)|nr:DUF389 domain-containing protein [Bacteroidota bacterium]